MKHTPSGYKKSNPEDLLKSIKNLLLFIEKVCILNSLKCDKIRQLRRDLTAILSKHFDNVEPNSEK